MNKHYFNQKEFLNMRAILNKPDGIIAFPTDTVWGMGCKVYHKDAVDRIYQIKSRSKIKPLILLGSKMDHLVPFLGSIHDKAWEIINKYLPGGVTVVLPKSPKTPDFITSGMNTVGIRIPDHPVFLDLLENAVDEHVLATTSANISDLSSSVTKQQTENSVGNLVDYVLDDFGHSARGAESTVLSVDDTGNINILRQGAIYIEI
jgi:L-threonylcarbamoyladenylate synthase